MLDNHMRTISWANPYLEIYPHFIYNGSCQSKWFYTKEVLFYHDYSQLWATTHESTLAVSLFGKLFLLFLNPRSDLTHQIYLFI